MKSISFAKALTLGCVMTVAALPLACGDDDDDGGNNGGTGNTAAGGEGGGEGGGPVVGQGGEGGMPAITIPGTSPTSKTVTCGEEMCRSISTVSPTLFVDPCCTADDACGVATQFLGVLGAEPSEMCAAKGQEGPADTACPDSDAQMVPVGAMSYPVPGFKGCCRAATGTCGVIVDDVKAGPITFASFGLGCVDSEPFFNEEGAPCGGGEGGAGGGGAGGAAGAGGAGGAGGEAGAPVIGGAGAGGAAAP